MPETKTIPRGSAIAIQFYRAGVAALQREKVEDAVQHLRRAVELDPLLEDAWNDLGVVMEAIGNPREALRCYRQSLSVCPEQPEALDNLSKLLVQLDLAQALRRYASTSSAA